MEENKTARQESKVARPTKLKFTRFTSSCKRKLFIEPVSTFYEPKSVKKRFYRFKSDIKMIKSRNLDLERIYEKYKNVMINASNEQLFKHGRKKLWYFVKLLEMCMISSEVHSVFFVLQMNTNVSVELEHVDFNDKITETLSDGKYQFLYKRGDFSQLKII
jgi:hypothetical protein